MYRFRSPALLLRSVQLVHGDWALWVTDLILKGKAYVSLSGCFFNRVGHHMSQVNHRTPPCFPADLAKQVPPPALLSNIYTAHPLPVFSSVYRLLWLANMISPPTLSLSITFPGLFSFPPFPLSCVIWHVCTRMHACMCMHGAALDGCWNCPAFLPCCFEARSLNQSQRLPMRLISLDALGNSLSVFWSWNNRQAATPTRHSLGSGNPSLGPFACTGRHFNHGATCLVPLPAFYSYSYMTHNVTYSLHCSLLPLQALWC